MNIEEWQSKYEQLVLEYKELLKTGELTEQEYKELVDDLLDMKDLSDDLNLEDNKIRVQKAIDIIRAAAGLL
jgi:polyhydroxyalkanoate synthesis regulator phasin